MSIDLEPTRSDTDFADPQLLQLLERDRRRQNTTLAMVASSSVAPWQVLACNGSALSNVTGEGYPGARFHSGCEDFDDIERLAAARARDAFGASFANVQPHSGTNANLAALTALVPAGGRVLSMALDAGGHLSHGARASITSKHFEVHHYGLGADGLIDYDEVAQQAERSQPDLIICGGSSYPRTIDFRRFRAIADLVGARLLADISHVAGLVAAGLHPSPIPFAHLTTTSTYKQLAGPRGGLILGGRNVGDADQLERQVARAVFPGVQGTPMANSIAAKAWAMRYVTSEEFRLICTQIVVAARAIADQMSRRQFKVVTGGTDNHMVLIDLTDRGMSGWVAERALESCGLLVNRNMLWQDPLPPTVTSGIRLGTNSLAVRGGGAVEGRAAANIVADVLEAVEILGPKAYRLDAAAAHRASAAVRVMTSQLAEAASEPVPSLDVTGAVV
jgi:glycine hydroxymethyltransferase